MLRVGLAVQGRPPQPLLRPLTPRLPMRSRCSPPPTGSSSRGRQRGVSLVWGPPQDDKLSRPQRWMQHALREGHGGLALSTAGGLIRGGRPRLWAHAFLCLLSYL